MYRIGYYLVWLHTTSRFRLEDEKGQDRQTRYKLNRYLHQVTNFESDLVFSRHRNQKILDNTHELGYVQKNKLYNISLDIAARSVSTKLPFHLFLEQLTMMYHAIAKSSQCTFAVLPVRPDWEFA